MMNKYFIYMASGNSSRYGSNKLLEPFQGKPLYRYGMEVLKAVTRKEDCSVIVVSRYPQIRAEASSMGFQAVDCPESSKGASYTIKTGIQSIPQLKEEDYLIFVVADQPYLSIHSMKKLLLKTEENVDVARLFYGDRPGNPVLFSARLSKELLLLEHDQGGGVIARKHRCVPVYVEEELELKDIDRKADLWKR